MLSALNRRVSVRKLDRLRARCASSHDTFGLDRVKRPPLPSLVRKPQRLPFLKSVYAGQYDVELLTYPETLNMERHRDQESRTEQLRHIAAPRADTARQLGLFGMSAPYPSSGLDLTDTEIARVFEFFDGCTYRSLLDHTLSVDLIKTFGTPGQKSKYLPLLASGAVCSLHCDAVRATALPDRSWELDGSVHGSGDVLSLFVVENRAYIVENDKIAVHGDRLQLRRVVVSPDDVIDSVDLTRVKQRSMLYTVSVLINSLKKVFDSTVMCVLPKTRLNLKLREYDSVLKILGKAVINMYTIESMIYLTTWMMDGFENPDIELETAAIQLFARQTVGSTLSELKMLYGRNSIKEPFSTLCNDVDDIIDSLDKNSKLANFISIRGMEFFNKSNYQENVSFVTAAYRNMMMKRDEPSLKYGLKQFLHPALQHVADYLEYCVLKFQFFIDQNHASGQLSPDNQMLMERLSTVSTHIYAMTAVLGRASRSYCTGIRFSDYDMYIAETMVRESKELLQTVIEEIMSGKYTATDSVYESFANQILVNNTKKEQTKT